MPMPSEGEVTITCQANEVRIPDLGVFLTRGQSVKVAFTDAMKSRSLSQAKMDGTVTTQVVRVTSIRQPTATPPVVARVSERVSSDTTTSQSPRYTQEPVVDQSLVLGALSTLTDEIRGLRKDLASQPRAQAPVVDLSPVVRAIQGLRISGAQDTREVPSILQEAPSELFIPGKIVADTTPVNLDVASTSTEGGGVNDAADALKQARLRR